MSWLLIGKNGMLGSVFAQREVSLSKDLFCVDIDELDITDISNVRNIFHKIKPQYVINCSAYTNVDGAETEREKCRLINCDGVANLAVECAKIGAVLVHFSTDFVFDGTKKGAYNEDDPVNPLSYYGLTKLEGEKSIQSIMRLNDYLIIRTSWLFGPRGMNFVARIISLAGEKPKLQIVSDQIGNPTYTRDLAKAVILLLNKSARGIFHITNQGPCSWYDLARFALDEYGLQNYITEKIDSNQLNRPAKRPANSQLNISKFENLCNIKMRSWQEVVREYVHEFLIG